MAIIARGQITVRVSSDTYSVYQSVDKMGISCDYTGKVISTLALNSVISVRSGETPIENFNIGVITKPAGFSSITINQTSKTITYSIIEGDVTLNDSGIVDIPIIINGQTFHTSFGWYKIKAGTPGIPGKDSNLMDWVADWNSGRTVIDSQTIITPKIFAGIKNANNTITGIAIGKFPLSTINTSGTVSTEIINGIYGFTNGKKTFTIDATGNVQLGNDNEFIKYDAISGKIKFGSAVSLAWIGATYIDSNGIFTGTLSANTVNAININAAQIVSGTINAARIDVNSLKASLLTAGNIEALTLNVVRGKIGGWTIDTNSIFLGAKNNTSGSYTTGAGAITIGDNGIRGLKWRLDANGAGALAGGNISWDSTGNVTFSSTVSLNWTNIANTAAAQGKLYIRGTALNHNANRIVQLGSNIIVNGTGRGFNLSVINRNTLAIISNRTYDVYGNEDNCNALASDLNSLASDKIIIVTSYDAIHINASLNTALQRCGGSDNLIADARVPYALIGIPTIGKNNGLLSMYTTEASDPYAEISTVIINGTPQGININGKRNTYINGNGIYTGSITASQINTGTMSADRIATGSITAAKLDATSIKTSIINVDYINGLACTFSRGQIGGWMIGANALTNTHIALDNANKRVVVYGANSGPTNGQRVQLFYNSDSDFGLFATDTSGNCVTRLGSANQIAGWNITISQIYKNNVYLNSDGSIVNSSRWKLNNDGSGQIANGAISWNAAGIVTFSSAVSLNWANAATNALNSAKSYADIKKSEAINAASADATNKANAAKELASAMAFGKMLYRDPTFWNGNNGINVYNNSANGTVTITRTSDSNAPNDSKQILLIKNTGTSSPLCGGFYFGTGTSYKKVFITRILAKIPTGRSITYHSNAIGSGGSQKWLTPTDGTGEWCEYICKVSCGTENFSSTNFFAITGNVGTVNAPVQWWVAYATVFDITSTEKYPTTIDGNGIYTSTLNANQITAGSISADRIATGSLNGDKIAARTITATQIKASAITAYEIAGSTITAAEIASRTITASTIASSTITAYEIAGSTITAAEIASRTITASKIATGTITATEINVGSIQASVVTASAVNGLTCNFQKGKVGGFTLNDHALYSINATAGHTIGIQNNGYMYNCNSSTNTDYWALNTDGSAMFGTGKIKFEADGSGYVANQNIKWDGNGNVTMTGTITATAGKIGNFNISGGKLINSTTTASIEFSGLSGSSLYLNTTGSLISIRSDVNKTGIYIQTYSAGAKGIFVVANAGSTYALETYGPMQMGQRSGERWCVPGVLYVGCKYSSGYNNYYRKIWGDGMTISSFSHIGSGKYKVYHNLGHTDYTVIGMLWSTTTYYGYFRLLERTTSYFVIQNVGSSGNPDQAPFDFIVMGRNKW